MKDKESEVPNSGGETEETSKKNCKSSNESSSTESLLEIRLNEFVKRSEVTALDLRAVVVRCSSCNSQINHNSTKDLRKHRKLGVVTCKECYEFYGSSEFSQDESGYNYCTWCGNGGKLVVCDFCPNGFCGSCIRRNFGRAEISVTNKEGWKCYCCDKRRLEPKIKFCDLLIESASKRSKKEKKVARSINRNISEDWLQSAFDESDEACRYFHIKLAKLKAIGLKKSKSLKHIVKKMEQVVNDHKADLKKVITSLTEQYKTYVETQSKVEEKKTDFECIFLDENSVSKDPGNLSDISVSILSIPGTSSKLTKNDKASDSAVHDNASNSAVHDHASNSAVHDNASNSAVHDNTSNSVVHDNASNSAVRDNANNLEEKKIKAKLSLLKSSSESEEADCAEPADEAMSVDTDGQCTEKSGPNNSKNNDSDLSETKNLNKANSSSKTNTVNNASKAKAKRRLSFGFSDSSDSDFKDKPNVKELIENVETNLKEGEKVDEEKKEMPDVPVDTDNDPKLKCEAKVDLISCAHLLKSGETCLKIESGVDPEEELDKLVDSLCKFPLKKKKYAPKENKCAPKKKKLGGPLSARKAAAKKELMESSSSISLSSDEDEDQKNIKIGMKSVGKNGPSKESQGDTSSSNDLTASDSDEDSKKKSKKSKAGSKKAENSNSSDDFVPSKKKRKFDKLLHGSLLSGDEKKSKEKKEKKAPSRKRRVISSEEEKKKRSDKSNSATTSSEDEDFKKKKKPKKRRRIKQMSGSSEEAGDEENQENTPGKGRKNIRKIVGKDNLAASTKEAQLEEKERRKRVAERQKLYNKIEDTTVDGKEVITRKMVLEVDQESKAEIVEIDPDLVCKLKPHQVNGVKFMWECTIESVKDLDKPGSGCILAHCMGLGKTLQVIAFLHTCLTNSIVSKKIKRAMIICPYNTALNWASEFDFWLQDIEGRVEVHQLTNVKSNAERMDILKYWFVEGGVIIVSYDIFRRLCADKIARVKSKQIQQLKRHLLDPGPDIVVCDEGHILKNDKSAISLATAKLATRRRIVLTGTPLQNNLKEYHCMLSFVKPNLLGTSKEFLNRFVNPIINGQYDDSNDYDVKLMKKRIHILHKLLEGCVQRCDYSALTKFLPAKHEFVISVKLSEVQIKMYQMYLERRMSAQKDIKAVGKNLFADFTNLRCIWTHPFIYHISLERLELKQMFKDDADDDEEFINDASESEKSTSASSTSDDDKLIEKIRNDQKKEYRTRSRANEMSDSEVEEVVEKEKRWYHEFISDEDKFNIELSGKMVLLLDILKECEAIGDKIIVFSQSLLALDCIEDLLQHCSNIPVSEEDKNRDVFGTWIKGLDYFRMDGSTSVDFRKSYIDMFNNLSNDRARLFLISTRAGSLGTNLVGANRVVIMDTSWNPSHDVQAIFRVYRFGQIKPVYIYRLLAQGTMEEKIYDRQVTKLSLSCRVVDEQQIERHFSAADLAELYTFDPNATTNRPTPMVPKDRLLAEMLIKNKDWIVTYHEHDSLLQNQTEEDLTEEERQAAWTEYENEREGRAPPPGVLNAEDVINIQKDPDFSIDYEGKMIPDLKVIVESLFDRIKSQIPDPVSSIKFKERLMVGVCGYRQVLQEKHVKVLRMKQEYCSNGTVPNALNKYLDEVTQALRSTGEYVTKLNEVIQKDKIAERQRLFQQQQQINLQRLNSQQGARIIYQQRPFQGNFPQNNNMAGVRYFVRMPATTFAASNTRTYSQKAKEPTVVDPDDDAYILPDVTSNTSNKKSTVIIEEIS